jgi:hypothetical protein
MQERNPVEKGRGEQADLESRLAAYYGPELHEQSLPESSWMRLRTRLEPQRLSKVQRILQWYHRNQFSLLPGHLRWRVRRNGRPVPTHIRDAFSRLIYETRQPYPRLNLECSLCFLSTTMLPTYIFIDGRWIKTLKCTICVSPDSTFLLLYRYRSKYTGILQFMYFEDVKLGWQRRLRLLTST